MIMNGIGGANTLTGARFEAQVTGKNTHGIDLTKHKLYTYLKEHGIDSNTILSKKLIPDECYLDIENDELRVYEKKYQRTSGSVDEKPQTCAFKIFEFQKIAKALNVNKVTYTYIFNDWFKNDKYKDMLNFIKSVPGCDYYFEGAIDN